MQIVEMYQFAALLTAILAHVVAQQPKDGLTAPEGPSEDYVDRGQDGSYRFGYKNLDIGAHHHSAVASRDNTVSGRYGYRDPATRQITQTTYTAGNRGFRARGPDIARLMDLSQSKIPYQPPVSPNSPNYQPSYNGYHDPNEDPSYKFGQKTATYAKTESADSKGTVNGAFSYIDDVGKRHDVQYEAGSGTGFVVKTPFPDSDPFGGVFYRGPSKPGSRPRGHSSIVQRNDGSYQFTASGPDQKRVEVSDAAGRVRGSYTYVDDKGVQRTVHYVAGPNIGYKVVRKGTGPVYSSVYPYASPDFLQPPFAADEPVSLAPPLLPSSTVPSLAPGDLFEPANVDVPKTSDEKTLFDFPLVTNKPALSTTNFALDTLPTKSYYEPTKPPRLDSSTLSVGSGPATYYEPTKPPPRPDASRYDGGSTYYQPSKSAPPKLDLSGYNEGSTYYEPSIAPPRAGPNTLNAGGSTFYEPAKPPPPPRPDAGPFTGGSLFGSDTGGTQSFDDLFDGPADYDGSGNEYGRNRLRPTDRKPAGTGRKQPSNGYLYPKPEGGFKEEARDYTSAGDDNGYSGTSRNFLGLPPGVSVRAHVQSLDILPYGSKIPPPDETLQRHVFEERRLHRNR